MFGEKTWYIMHHNKSIHLDENEYYSYTWSSLRTMQSLPPTLGGSYEIAQSYIRFFYRPLSYRHYEIKENRGWNRHHSL